MTTPASPLPTGSPSTKANRLPSALTAPVCATSPLGETVRAPVPSTDTGALTLPPPPLVALDVFRVNERLHGVFWSAEHTSSRLTDDLEPLCEKVLAETSTFSVPDC